MNIIVCVNENGKFVPFSKLLTRPKTLDFVFKLLKNKILLCNKQDVKFLKLSPCAKMIIKDPDFKQKLPDFLTPQADFSQNETVATLKELSRLVCKMNPDRTFAICSLAEEILSTPDHNLTATKIYLITLSTISNLSSTQNIIPTTYIKTKTHSPILDDANLDYVSEYVLKTKK